MNLSPHLQCVATENLLPTGEIAQRCIQRFAGSFNFHVIRLLNSHSKIKRKVSRAPLGFSCWFGGRRFITLAGWQRTRVSVRHQSSPQLLFRVTIQKARGWKQVGTSFPSAAAVLLADRLKTQSCSIRQKSRGITQLSMFRTAVNFGWSI